MRRIFLSAGCLALLSLSACQSASSLLDAGNACYIRGDFVGSLDHYSAARRKDPTLPEIDQKIRLAELRLLIQRGDLAVQRSNWQEAERAYQEARRLDPGSEEVAERFQRMAAARANQRFLKGQELLLAGNALEAAAEFEQALVFQPDHRRAAEALERARAQGEDQKRKAEAEFQEGQRARAAGRLEEAAQHFARALELNPHNTAVRRELTDLKGRLAESFARQGDGFAQERAWSRAAEAYRRAHDYAPAFPGLAESLERAEKEARAETLVEEASRALDRGDSRTAFERFDEAWKLSEDRERFRVRYETARDQLAAAIDAEALVLERDGRLEEAFGRYRAVLAFHPHYRDVEARCERLRASLERAQVAYQAGCSAQAARDLLRAQDEFQMCARMAPGFRDVTARAAALREAVMRADDLYRRAAAAESRADRERARILFEECLSVSSPFRDAGPRLDRLREYEAALARAEARYQALLEAYRRQDFRHSLSLAREIRKECSGFRDVDQRLTTLELEVDYADAGALEAKGQYEEAIRCLERCAQRTPGFRDVDDRLRRCREKRGPHDHGVRDRGRGEGRSGD